MNNLDTKSKIRAHIVMFLLILSFIVFQSANVFAEEYDYEGITVPQGEYPDAGAIEYVPDVRIVTPLNNFGANKTNYASFLVEGVADPSTMISIVANGVEVGQVLTGGDSIWSTTVNLTPINEGEVSLVAISAGGATSTALDGVLTKTYNVNAPRNLRVVGQ